MPISPEDAAKWLKQKGAERETEKKQELPKPPKPPEIKDPRFMEAANWARSSLDELTAKIAKEAGLTPSTEAGSMGASAIANAMTCQVYPAFKDSMTLGLILGILAQEMDTTLKATTDPYGQKYIEIMRTIREAIKGLSNEMAYEFNQHCQKAFTVTDKDSGSKPSEGPPPLSAKDAMERARQYAYASGCNRKVTGDYAWTSSRGRTIKFKRIEGNKAIVYDSRVGGEVELLSEVFMFRGLKFRDSGNGIEVFDPKTDKWYGSGFHTRRSLEQMTEIPDISLWENRVPIRQIRFPQS